MSDTIDREYPDSDVESEDLLEDMGYSGQLQRGLNLVGNVCLTLSDITPTASLLVVGTASAWVNPRFKMPWVSTLLVGVCGAVLCLQSSLIRVVTFTSVLIIVFLRPRSDRYWSHLTVPEHELPVAAAEAADS